MGQNLAFARFRAFEYTLGKLYSLSGGQFSEEDTQYAKLYDSMINTVGAQAA